MKKKVTSFFIVIAIIMTLFANTLVANAAMGDYGGNITGATWYWPLRGFTSESSAYSKITSSYGYRGGSYNSDHKGMDIGASNGTAVYPTRSGTIYLADASPDDSEGRSIIINHGDGYYSAYYHLSSLNVSKGQWVDTNTQIGAVGGSGYGQDGYYAYHLHFAIHYGSSWSYTCNVNPCPSGYTRVGSSMQASAGGYPKGNATISYAVTTTPQYDSKPSNVQLKVDKSMIAVNETITFVCSALDAAGYTIGIYKNGTRIFTGDIPSAFSKAFSEAGSYTAYISAWNPKGVVDSNTISFSVYNSAPTSCKLNINKNTVAVNESITFSCTASGARGYTIGINKDGKRIYTSDVGNPFSKSFSEPGTYTAYMTAWNTIGLVDSNVVSFTVYNSSPDKAELVVDKNVVRVNEAISFKCDASKATGYTIGINKDGKRIYTSDVGNPFSKSFSEPGTYTAYMTAWNTIGLIDSNKVSFVVYNTAPTSSEIATNKSEYYTNENVIFNFSSKEATGYTIGIYKDGKRVFTGDVNNPFSKSFSEPGTYSAYVTAWNSIGILDSKKITFYVGKYTLNFDSNGGTPSVSKAITHGMKYGTLPTPTYEGYRFVGWFTAPNGGTQITSDSTVLITDNQTLYAQWEYIEPHTETIINKSGNTITVSTNLFSITSGKIIVCGYKSGRLIDFVIKDYSFDKETFELTGDIDTVKVMTWDGLSTIKPLCNAEEIPQSEWIM